MEIKEKIIHFAQAHRKFRTKDLVLFFKKEFSRQYIARILNILINEGILIKDGSTKASFYALANNSDAFGNSLVRRFENKNLEEHTIFMEIEKQFRVMSKLDENIYSIIYYALSEMLNNAIEHSESDIIEVYLEKRKTDIVFAIRDFGIGVFKNIQKKRGLNSEFEAVQDLLKGKTTTAPKAHSGEGIFFTSKIADVFVIESFDLGLRIDNANDDVFLEDLKRSKKGTRVIFQISMKSKKHLNKVFEKYQTDPETFEFDKTEIKVKLYTMGTIYISRSQARRILSGLDKFKLVLLDFENVPAIGQAFADEIFRVFKEKHPNITIEAVNTNPAIDFMIQRAVKTQR